MIFCKPISWRWQIAVWKMAEFLRRRLSFTFVLKKDNQEDLRKWRPVSLLDADYKILTKTLVHHLRLVMSSIIYTDRTTTQPYSVKYVTTSTLVAPCTACAFVHVSELSINFRLRSSGFSRPIFGNHELEQSCEQRLNAAFTTGFKVVLRHMAIWIDFRI